MNAIAAEHLTKVYRLATASRLTLQQDFARWWAGVRRRPDPHVKIGQERSAGDLFWALDDVSFQVNEGEVLGVIGRNGAGKSTLLKILSEVTAPTSGQIALRGRVASLLEVGTGFHPDLTGRENVYMNGAILGMSKAEIRSQFDAIVAFSECEGFIDTQVKRYSSGMLVRLAFAVAAHLEQEILIIDEVLAVGDVRFQQKCLRKMEEVGRSGRTILFVSHDMNAVQRLCSQAILLDNGRLAASGAVNAVVERYLAGAAIDSGHRRQGAGEGESRIVGWRLVDTTTGLEHCCQSGEVATFEILVESTRQIERAHLDFAIRTLAGDRMIAAKSVDSGQERFPVREGTTRIRATVRLPLKTDRYRLELRLADEQRVWDHWQAEPLLTVLSSDPSRLPAEQQGLIDEPVSFGIHS